MLDRRTRKALERTEARLDRHGWRRGTYGNERMGYCLVGAVRASTYHPLVRWRAYRLLLEAGGERSRPWFRRIRLTHLNDRRLQQGEVIRIVMTARRWEP